MGWRRGRNQGRSKGTEKEGGDGKENRVKRSANNCEYSRLQSRFSHRVIVILRLRWCREFYPFHLFDSAISMGWWRC